MISCMILGTVDAGGFMMADGLDFEGVEPVRRRGMGRGWNLGWDPASHSEAGGQNLSGEGERNRQNLGVCPVTECERTCGFPFPHSHL